MITKEPIYFALCPNCGGGRMFSFQEGLTPACEMCKETQQFKDLCIMTVDSNASKAFIAAQEMEKVKSDAGSIFAIRSNISDTSVADRAKVAVKVEGASQKAALTKSVFGITDIDSIRTIDMSIILESMNAAILMVKGVFTAIELLDFGYEIDTYDFAEAVAEINRIGNSRVRSEKLLDLHMLKASK